MWCSIENCTNSWKVSTYNKLSLLYFSYAWLNSCSSCPYTYSSAFTVTVHVWRKVQLTMFGRHGFVSARAAVSCTTLSLKHPRSSRQWQQCIFLREPFLTNTIWYKECSESRWTSHVLFTSTWLQGYLKGKLEFPMKLKLAVRCIPNISISEVESTPPPGMKSQLGLGL